MTEDRIETTERPERRIIKSYEDLDVYQKAYALALEVHNMSLGLPKIEQYALADQMRRGSKSICANIAEGFAKQRQSQPEFKRFLGMAIGSSDEMKVWLSFCQDLGYVPASAVSDLKTRYSIVARMLTGLLDRWR
jgi:four helix bundle protein